MLSVSLARRLHNAGVRWSPRAGDRFVVQRRGMDDEVFVVSEMTVEVQDIPGGQVIGFNGTTEWALDSVAADDALWLPRESQLREALGPAFRSLERTGDGWRVVTEQDGDVRITEHADAEEAYGLALVRLLSAASLPRTGSSG